MTGIVFIGVLLSATIVGAQDYDPPFGLITANNAVVRAGPDFAYPIIEQLPIDTSVVILGRAGSFFSRFDGRQWMAGATHYSVVIEAPSGLRRTFDTKEPSLTVTIGSLNREAGIYTWSVIPYWTDTPNPRDAQRLCIERQGGTLEKPDTTPMTPTPESST